MSTNGRATLDHYEIISVRSVATFSVLVLLLYYAINAIYCIYFHPLAIVPGPLLARISVWPSFYHTLKGNRHIWLWQCHEIYGTTVRYRPDAVALNSPEAFRTIYGTRANVKKGRSYGVWPKQSGAINTFSCINKGVHARRRRVLTSALSEKAVRSAERFVIQHTDRWCELLSENSHQWSQPKNMTDWSDHLIFDILCELCYGKSWDTKEPGENSQRSVPHDIVHFMEIIYPIMMSPFVDVWLWLKPRGLDRLFATWMPANLKEYTRFVEESLGKRINEERRCDKTSIESTRKDMIHYLYQAKDSETENLGYTRAELIEECDMLTVAGSDTTSGAQAALFFYLLHNSTVLEKLKQELRKTFTDVNDIRLGSQLSSCSYLKAVIDETLRMSPPGSSDMMREVLPGGIVVNGYCFPAGTHVATAIYALHHSAELYPDPFVFRPERWISGADISEKSIALAESGFFPFSTGIRGCPGKSLAYMQLSIITARLLYKLDLKGEEGDISGEGNSDLIWGRRDKGQFQTRDALVPVRNGPQMKFRFPIIP